MRTQLYAVLPHLQPYIKLICTMDCDEEEDRSPIRVLPDTCVELFINYSSTPVAIIDHELHQRSIVNSRMSRPADVQMRKGAGCLAICFYPGVAYRFFRVPMHVLSDTTVALSDLWSGLAVEIEERLADAPDHDTRVAIVQNYLLQQIHADMDPQLAYCLQQAQRSGGQIPVGQLCSGAGISQRHLARKFQQTVGLSPKEYLRVSRFLHSLQHLRQQAQCSLTSIAYQSGYYDQAHFNRDYKTYAGCSPGELIRAQHILY